MTSQHDRDSRELRELCAQRDAARATVRQQAERIAELEKEALAKPFAPDSGYRQGLEDGKREGQAERDRLLKTVADDTTLVFDLCAERDQLRAEVERYRHLRNGQSWPAVFASHDAPEPLRGYELDTAIDHARTHKDTP